MEQTLPKMLREIANKHPDIPAQYSRNKDGNFYSISYKNLYQNSLLFGAGLLSLGVKRGDRIGLISDNRKEWFQADMGLMAIGAADVPRGCDATPGDLSYILSFSECFYCIVENSTQIKKICGLLEKIPYLKTFICFEAPDEASIELVKSNNLNLFTFDEILSKGKDYTELHPNCVEQEIDKGQWTDIATIVFTSGTTGTPKGVMLSHGNFLTQLDELPERIPISPGDKALCVLPVWHVFQRLCEYVITIQAGSLCYSKPVASILLADFQKLNPSLMPAVPRVFEAVYEGIMRAMRKTGGIANLMFKFFVNVAKLHCSIDRRLFRKKARFGYDYIFLWWPLLVLPWLFFYPLRLLGNVLVFKKIKEKLGKNFRLGISGGGAYPPAVDAFYWAIGVNVVEGYGLTETAPVISVRPWDAPVFGTVGSAIRGVNVRVVDDEGNVLPQGKKGVLEVQGETVMKGYYRRPDLTSKVISNDGWFNTGDIAMLTVNNEIVLKGRKKDTIVLRGGENIEPLPIEMKLTESRYISTAVVVGQDQRNLGVLLILDQDEVKAFAAEHNLANANDYEQLIKSKEIKSLVESEISNLVSSKTGFKMYEKVAQYCILTKPFEVGVELSAKQEIMRYKINELYAKQIANMFKG